MGLQHRLGLLDLELARAKGSLTLRRIALARDECIEALLQLCLATGKQLLSIRAIDVALGASKPKPSAFVCAGLLVVELLRPLLDLELPSYDIRGALSQGTLQILDLDESLGTLALARLREPPSQLENVVPIGSLLRLLPGCVPAGRLPGIPP
jgi:hypothetical protein